MTYQLVFTDQYNRRAARWLRRHPELRNQYLKTLQLLEANPYHPSLRLHALRGTVARRAPRTAAPHYTVIKTLAPTGKRYGRRGAGTSEGDPLEAR